MTLRLKAGRVEPKETDVVRQRQRLGKHVSEATNIYNTCVSVGSVVGTDQEKSTVAKRMLLGMYCHVSGEGKGWGTNMTEFKRCPHDK